MQQKYESVLKRTSTRLAGLFDADFFYLNDMKNIYFSQQKNILMKLLGIEKGTKKKGLCDIVLMLIESQLIFIEFNTHKYGGSPIDMIINKRLKNSIKILLEQMNALIDSDI